MGYYKKYKDNYYIIIVSIAVAFTNFVDNDLFSYNFLPILLLAFNSNIEDTIKLPLKEEVRIKMISVIIPVYNVENI